MICISPRNQKSNYLCVNFHVTLILLHSKDKACRKSNNWKQSKYHGYIFTTLHARGPGCTNCYRLNARGNTDKDINNY